MNKSFIPFCHVYLNLDSQYVQVTFVKETLSKTVFQAFCIHMEQITYKFVTENVAKNLSQINFGNKIFAAVLTR